MTLRTFFKPENAFGTKDVVGQQIIQKMLEFTNGEGAIAFKGERAKAIIF